MLPPITDKHALLCGIVTGTLAEYLPSHFSVCFVDDAKGTHLAGCVIQVGDDVYELQILPLQH